MIRRLINRKQRADLKKLAKFKNKNANDLTLYKVKELVVIIARKLGIMK